jgi:hypothetical protein
MAKTNAKQETEHEAEIVEQMSSAWGIAEKLFGAQSNVFAVHEIFDYLAESDEAEFAADLTRTIEHAKIVYKTTAPTPEQVFGLFDRIFIAD